MGLGELGEELVERVILQSVRGAERDEDGRPLVQVRSLGSSRCVCVSSE